MSDGDRAGLCGWAAVAGLVVGLDMLLPQTLSRTWWRLGARSRRVRAGQAVLLTSAVWHLTRWRYP